MFIQNDDSKPAEMILFISARSEGDERFGAVKLNKILFFADFAAYLLYGQSITGQEYQRLPNGPAPRRLVPVRDALIAMGELAMRKVEYFNQKQNRTFALREADLRAFSAEQIALVTEVIENNWECNATEMSYRSHKFHGWEDASHNKTIPYEMVLLSTRAPSESETQRCLQNATLAADALAGKLQVVPLDA